jgi:hypothetical protein
MNDEVLSSVQAQHSEHGKPCLDIYVAERLAMTFVVSRSAFVKKHAPK